MYLGTIGPIPLGTTSSFVRCVGMPRLLNLARGLEPSSCRLLVVPPRRTVRPPIARDAVTHLSTLATVVMGLDVVATGSLATVVRRCAVAAWNCRLV